VFLCAALACSVAVAELTMRPSQVPRPVMHSYVSCAPLGCHHFKAGRRRRHDTVRGNRVREVAQLGEATCDSRRNVVTLASRNGAVGNAFSLDGVVLYHGVA
jgi:hypothetical protein